VFWKSAVPESDLILRWIMTVLILAGAAVFLYFYHVRTRRFDPSSRQRLTLWRPYELIDWYLKISTVIISLTAVHLDHSLLLEIHDRLVLRLVGLTLAGCALLLFGAAMWTLDSQYTPAHKSHLPSLIVTAGPYRFIRHPVYTSNLLLLIGLFLTTGSLWLVVNWLILISYYIPTILLEEAAILRSYPEYREYSNSTGRFFPRLGSIKKFLQDGR
jgi:protein-S-isoprenylcysteine O-methyltransferase Ste14